VLALAGAIGSLLIVWTLLGGFSDQAFGQIDRCFSDRFLDGEPQHHQKSLLPKFLFGLTILCFLALAARAYFRPPPTEAIKKKNDSAGASENYFSCLIFYLGTGTTFYSVTYCSSKVIEYFLNDIICSRHLNGISGHYLFHVYFVLLFAYLPGFFNHYPTPKDITVQKVVDSLKKDVVYVAIIGAAILFSSITLSWTWFGGFHSPRQILYGILLSLLSHFVFVYVTENFLNPTLGSKYRIQAVMGMVIVLVILLLASTVIGTWPFTNLDFMATVILNAATVYIAAQDNY